jgi:hypothetical protein
VFNGDSTIGGGNIDGHNLEQDIAAKAERFVCELRVIQARLRGQPMNESAALSIGRIAELKR